MVTYIDAVQPLVHEYDGFLVHSRSANGAPLSVAPLTPLAAPTPTLIRTDLDVPVFVFQTETDIGPFGGYQARQPDTDWLPPMGSGWNVALRHLWAADRSHRRR